MTRPSCPRCLRPASACWCAELAPVPTRTRVVFLQHPREARVAIGTARIAHLGLANSELHEGIDFSTHPRIRELLLQPGTALLFPGDDAVPPEDLGEPPRTLLILDGTWPQARKMMALNPALHALPRIRLAPARPGNYRIRREPAQHCVATVEAVVAVLAALEGDPARFTPLISAFESMVDRQIAAEASRTEPPRQRLRKAGPWWEAKGMPDLRALWPHLVAVAAEANTHRRDSDVPGNPEILQLAAVRPATGDTFHAFLAPRRPLAPNAHNHLDVPREAILGGQPVDSALARWNQFLQPGDRLVGWGGFAPELLAREGWVPACEPLDLRPVAAHRLKRRPGSPNDTARAIGAAPAPAPLPGRAGRTAASIASILRQLHQEHLSAPG